MRFLPVSQFESPKRLRFLCSFRVPQWGEAAGGADRAAVWRFLFARPKHPGVASGDGFVLSGPIPCITHNEVGSYSWSLGCQSIFEERLHTMISHLHLT